MNAICQQLNRFMATMDLILYHYQNFNLISEIIQLNIKQIEQSHLKFSRSLHLKAILSLQYLILPFSLQMILIKLKIIK